MKKLLAILLSLCMVLSLGVSAFAEANVAEEEEEVEPVIAEFQPNTDYAYWTVVEYTIEAIGADLVCTISASEDFDEFYMECNFYGDDQMSKTKFDGTNYEVVEDLTGFMGGDTPAILDIARENDLWLAMPEFDPNPEYAYWTVTEYTIEAIGADLVCTISANEDFTEFYMECNFYGDDQMSKTTFDGENYEVVEDLTGFMGGDTPAILDLARENNIWAPIEAEAE